MCRQAFFTGGDGPNVCLWDVRFIDGGPVRRYHGDGGTTTCLAREPHHGNLIAGGPMPFGAMNFWNFETGVSRALQGWATMVIVVFILTSRQGSLQQLNCT